MIDDLNNACEQLESVIAELKRRKASGEISAADDMLLSKSLEFVQYVYREWLIQ